MEILNLQVFVSLLLVVGSLVLLGYSLKHGDHEHADRLTLLPLEDDDHNRNDKPAAPDEVIQVHSPDSDRDDQLAPRRAAPSSGKPERPAAAANNHRG